MGRHRERPPHAPAPGRRKPTDLGFEIEATRELRERYGHPEEILSNGLLLLIREIDPVGEPWRLACGIARKTVALSSLVRLATNQRVFVQPDTVDVVLDYIDVLLDPPAHIVIAGSEHWPRLADLCRELDLRGNLVPDAYLAALALEQRAELVTFDRGFARCLLDA